MLATLLAENLKQTLKALGGSLGEIVEYQSYPEVYADLANGRLDYAVNSVVSASIQWWPNVPMYLLLAKPLLALVSLPGRL